MIWPRIGALVLGLLLAAPPSAAELRRLEVVGAVPAGADAPSDVPVRSAALRAALMDGVTRVARDLLDPEVWSDPEFDLEAVLGAEPTAYTSRFGILEDRGERRALLVADPDVSTEYVVLVAVHVDVDRVRRRLAAAGLLALEDAPGVLQRYQVVLEEVPSYRAYRGVQDQLLERAGAERVVPIQFSGHRAVLLVETDREILDLFEALRGAEQSRRLQIEVLDLEADRLRLRVVELPPLEPDELVEGAAAFDTPDPNRY